MKMAKASEADLSMAMDLVNVLDDIERGFFPTKLQSDEDAESERVEWIDTNDRQQYERLFFGLKHLLNKGSISRVIFGMVVVCDPANKCIDPNADTIEHHPERQQMEDALFWVLYHHQGGSSHIGQPIRKLLGVDRFAHLTKIQLEQAKAFGNAAITAVPATASFPSGSLGEEVEA
jgi:hypothetical protein